VPNTPNTHASFSETIKYCLLVLKRSKDELLDAVGLNRQTIATAVFYFVALFLRFRSKGRPVVIEELASLLKLYLLDAVWPTVITALAVSAVCIIKAAASIHKEQSENISNTNAARPKLTGFFQNCQVYSYGHPTQESSQDGKAILFFSGHERPLGLEVLVKFRMVNEALVSTTLHNFNLKIIYKGQEGFAAHADEWVRDEDEVNEEDKTIFWLHNMEAARRCPNLVTYLRTYEMTQGKALEGGLVFRFPGLIYDLDREPANTVNLTLGIEDAWGALHFIEDKWGRKPPPLPRRVGSRGFIGS
jgi:hypothetical protein